MDEKTLVQLFFSSPDYVLMDRVVLLALKRELGLRISESEKSLLEVLEE